MFRFNYIYHLTFLAEEALQVIAEKQKEILELYKKLEENNVSRLEQDELKERIHDLIVSNGIIIYFMLVLRVFFFEIKRTKFFSG